MKCLLSALALVCVIAFCFSVGKTYAVITEATNVVVNTFYGESESQETKTDEPDTEEPGSETETGAEAEAGDETGTDTETEEETDTDTGTSGTETETGTSETDTTEGVKTGDGFNILLWIIIALAALIILIFCLQKLFRPRKK